MGSSARWIIIESLKASNPEDYMRSEPRKYGFFKFLGDILMVCLTGGFWLIWIFVREMRRR